jgi:hypothetical protein
MFRLLFILVVIIDVLVIIDIARSNKDSEKKMLWVLVVFFLPVLGPILYYVIGRK